MYYFAYGSNMDQTVMIQRGIRYIHRRVGILQDYELCFNKIARANSTIGFANVIPKKNALTEGILYQINKKDLIKLDLFEGYPKHYNRIIETIYTQSEQKKDAVLYLANKDKTRSKLLPTNDYLNHLLAAKDMLSEEYIKKLRKTKTIND